MIVSELLQQEEITRSYKAKANEEDDRLTNVINRDMKEEEVREKMDLYSRKHKNEFNDLN